MVGEIPDQVPPFGDERMWNGAFSPFDHPTLQIAAYVRLFDLLEGEKRLSISEIVGRMPLGDTTTWEPLLTLLAGLGYLEVQDNKYCLTELSKVYLTASSPFNWTPMLLLPGLERNQVLETLRNRHNTSDVTATWESGFVSMEDAKSFSAAMHSHSICPAIKLAQSVDFQKEFHVKRVLDVGGGSGCYSIALAQQQPGLETTVADLENVCKVCEEDYISRAKLPEGSTVKVLPMDMFKQEFPKNSYDAFLFCNILHDWDENQCRLLIEKSFKSLPSKGFILIVEALLDTNEGEDVPNGKPIEAARMSVLMLVTTKGKQFTFGGLSNLLTEGGFETPKVYTFRHSYKLVSAQKS